MYIVTYVKSKTNQYQVAKFRTEKQARAYAKIVRTESYQSIIVSKVIVTYSQEDIPHA